MEDNLVARCKNCKYWEAVEWPFEEPKGAEGARECVMMQSGDGRQVHPETLAWSNDAEQYHSFGLTKADFGCVMFSLK